MGEAGLRKAERRETRRGEGGWKDVEIDDGEIKEMYVGRKQ